MELAIGVHCVTSEDVKSGPHVVPRSEAAIARLPVPEADEVRYWHENIQGLYLRVRAGGSRTWVLQYRSGGMKKKVTLGRSPAMTAAAAAQAAKVNLGRVAVGDDPAAARDAKKVKAIASVPLKAVFEDYLRHATQKASTRYHAELTRYLMQDLASLHRVGAGDLSPELMARAVGKVAGKTAPNRAKAALSSALKFAAGSGIVPAATYYAARLIPANPEAVRDRVLSYLELGKIWRAAAPDNIGGVIIRLLILTACRKSEIGGLHSAEVDREKGIITIGADRMKAGAKHIVPVTPTIGALLPDRDGYLFGKIPEAAFSGWSRVKSRIDASTRDGEGNQIAPWVVHDFRHTISTHLNEQRDANPDLIDRLLAHKRKGTEALYNHAQLIDAKRDLLLTWENILRAEGVIHD
jgi:integrase